MSDVVSDPPPAASDPNPTHTARLLPDAPLPPGREDSRAEPGTVLSPVGFAPP